MKNCNILSISLEESTISNTTVLDWVVGDQAKGGSVTEKYWLINVNVLFNNPENNEDAQKLRNILNSCLMNNYQILIIRK